LIAAAPQNDAGRITEPPVWVPSASGIMPAPTAAAEPAEDPPGVWPGLCGLSVAVGSFDANAVVVVLPMMVAPAAFSAATTGASARGCTGKRKGWLLQLGLQPAFMPPFPTRSG
jgi:hypothetical protein